MTVTEQTKTRQVANRLYYALNRESVRAQQRAYHELHGIIRWDRCARRYKWYKANLNILKAAQGCDDCGTHVRRLNHHHTDPTTKRYDVSSMYGYSVEVFLDEVAKCKVLCYSCHMRLHRNPCSVGVQSTQKSTCSGTSSISDGGTTTR